MLSGKGRELRVTEKGRGYQAAQKSKLYGQLLKKLRSEGSSLIESVAQKEKLQVIKQGFDVWKHDYVEFIQTHEVLCSLIEEEERKKLQEKHAEILTEVNELKGKMEAHLSSVCTDEVPRAESEAGRSRSSRMSRSSSEVKAQVVLMKLRMQQDQAELEARAAMSKKRLLLKQKQEQLLLEQEQLDIETQRKITEAKLKVVDQFDTDDQEGTSFKPGVREPETVAVDVEGTTAAEVGNAHADATCGEDAHTKRTAAQVEKKWIQN